MLKSFLWSHSFRWIVFHDLFEKINEIVRDIFRIQVINRGPHGLQSVFSVILIHALFKFKRKLSEIIFPVYDIADGNRHVLAKELKDGYSERPHVRRVSDCVTRKVLWSQPIPAVYCGGLAT
jgi:hypothetical protein